MQFYLARLLLRMELVAVFAYAGFGTIFAPQNYLAWLPSHIFGSIAAGNMAARIFAVVEILLVFWIVSNKRVDLASVFAASILVGIAFLNLSSMDVVFRNIGLAFGAVALYALEKEKKEEG